MKDATIYIAGVEEGDIFAEGKPCLLCRRMIRNAQIKQVVYLSKDGGIVKIEDVMELDAPPVSVELGQGEE